MFIFQAVRFAETTAEFTKSFADSAVVSGRIGCQNSNNQTALLPEKCLTQSAFAWNSSTQMSLGCQMYTAASGVSA
jgi:hypothetical protein